jgi:hypothetical protein
MRQTRLMFWPSPHHRIAAMLPNSAPPSAPAPDHASSREAVRRAVVNALDNRWQGLWGTFGMSVILLSFGLQLALQRWDEEAVSALALLVAGAILWLVHRQGVTHWRAQLGAYCDWLSPLDQGLVALGLLASVMVPDGAWWWPVPLLAASTWGVVKLWANAQAHWAHWHFVTARRILRERRGPRRTGA